jgi:ABC-type multidrug transport system permease subunit
MAQPHIPHGEVFVLHCWWFHAFFMYIMLIFTLAIGGNNISCAEHKFIPIIPLGGFTCGQYMDYFMMFACSYLADSDAEKASSPPHGTRESSGEIFLSTHAQRRVQFITEERQTVGISRSFRHESLYLRCMFHSL